MAEELSGNIEKWGEIKMAVEFRAGTRERQKQLIQFFRGKQPARQLLVRMETDRSSITKVAFSRMSYAWQGSLKENPEMMKRKGLEILPVEEVLINPGAWFECHDHMGYPPFEIVETKDLKEPFRGKGGIITGDTVEHPGFITNFGRSKFNYQIQSPAQYHGLSCAVCGEAVHSDGWVNYMKLTGQQNTQSDSYLHRNGLLLETGRRLTDLFREGSAQLSYFFFNHPPTQWQGNEGWDITVGTCHNHLNQLVALEGLATRYGVLTKEMVDLALDK